MLSFRAFAALTVLPLVGCMPKAQQEARGPTSVPALEQTWTETPIAVPAQSAMAVKEGLPPLVYLVETDSVVRVVDTTANIELLNMPVMARQIVSLNPELGVQIGGAIMRRGALPADHHYAIYLQSTTGNISRSGVIRPGRQP